MAELAMHSSTSDGWLFDGDYTGDYNAAWAAATGIIYRTGDYIRVGQYHFPANTYELYRGILYFDTSSIPLGASIIAAVLSLYGSVDRSATDFDIVVQSGQPTYPSDPAVVGDYSKANYSGDGGSVNTSTWSLAGYNELTLNSTGRGWIQKGTGATTKLCLRGSGDIAGTAPTGDEFVEFYSAEKAGSYRPRLVITYGATFPSDAVARVSSIRHIFRPGMFRMQVGLGDLGLDIDVAEATVRKELDTAKEIEEALPPLYVGPGERGEPARPARAEPITPFDFRTPEDIGVSAKVTGPEPTPSPISQEALRQTPSLAQRLTPWREEEGETPLTELMKGYRFLREWWGGLFK